LVVRTRDTINYEYNDYNEDDDRYGFRGVILVIINGFTLGKSIPASDLRGFKTVIGGVRQGEHDGYNQQQGNKTAA
jgi:hypothetical protein